MLGDKRVIKIYKLDNSMKTLLAEEKSTIGSLVYSFVEKAGIRNWLEMAPSFSLHECLDGVTSKPQSMCVVTRRGYITP
jgi:hypothetical protein